MIPISTKKNELMSPSGTRINDGTLGRGRTSSEVTFASLSVVNYFMTFFFVRILGGLSRKVGHQLAGWLANDLPGDEDQFNSEQPVPQPT